jgi:RimJ/RimL family protein N-acetyltransferase
MAAMSDNLFQGKLVRLVTSNPEEKAKLFSRWNRNSLYARLLDDQPQIPFSEKKIKEWFEKDLDKLPPESFFFNIQVEDSQKVIGFIGLWTPEWSHSNSWVSIGIGEPDYWGKGCGTEAMQLVLRYAFTELNLHRVSLGVFGYNQRAIRSYEKAGFALEGVARKAMSREGQRWDIHFMGVLRSEWERSQ